MSSFLFVLLGAFIACIFVSVTGFALFRGGYIPSSLSSSLTGTAIAQNSANCQALIDRAIQASGSYCGETNSNKVCYGNTTIQAELVPDANQRFSERGDIITVNELRRLSASPLKLETNEWGIAVFKLIANLPRSLPGETITMLVFGNATLDNDSGNSDSLESFYFSSELGQISCEKVPFDGLIINSPEGQGIQFMVNGAELTLVGDASIKAIKNGEMEVSIYNGSGKIISNGQEQYFGAGQKVKVKLGGTNGNQSVGSPSEPEPLTQEELDISCAMTDQYCSETEITPVSEEESQGQVQSEITSTPTLSPTPTLTGIPTITVEPTNTLLVLPSPTLSPTTTFTPKPPTATKIPPTRTKTSVPIPPTSTPSSPTNPVCGSVSISNLTMPNSNVIALDITNNSGNVITINRFFSYWVKTPQSQKLDRLLLDTNLIWNTSDSDSPSDIPTEGNWRSGVDRTIPNSTTRTLNIQFQNGLQATGYEARVIFDIGCQIIGIK
ncbi:MAG TPA: hypothetical protein VLA72_11120 [Anaerolineales bacterium]|nr:hypothetical protein [Anaerolineales bacterium]